jgi:DNA-binding transcriptional ArsR family regulator
MAKPYGRQTRKKVGEILREDTRVKALTRLAQIPNEQLVGHLFSHFYDRDQLIKFRSIAAMGELGKRIAAKHMEKARILMRRIMWNLNDESGGIGWGSPEAMGEILSKSPQLALEFKSILFSYLDPRGNFLEHGVLQQGVLWGIGTYLEAEPNSMSEITKGLIFSHLHSFDPIKRGYAVRALINGASFNCSIVPEHIPGDSEKIDIFSDWNFVATPISDMALGCGLKKAIT